MRYTPLLLLLLCSSCQRWSWGGAADVLIPDEFTMGQGSSSMLTSTTGGYTGHSDMFEYEGDGEGESTYAAFTWSLPSIDGNESGMDRETQRNFALLVDHMVAEEGLAAGIDAEAEEAIAVPSMFNIRPGVSLPPKEVLFGILGAILILFAFIRFRNQAQRRQW